MKSKVSIVRCASYDEELVYENVKRSLDLLGGIERFIKTKSKVLVKPNLLSSYTPESGVTTHPAVVGAVIRLLKGLSCDVYVGDSPGIETVKTFSTYEKVLKNSGISRIVDKYGGRCIHFKESVLLPKRKEYLFKDIKVANEALKMDAIINIPKLKTHVQMYLTLCVKNMFGCVVGSQKAHWHLRAGTDYRYFARMLVEIYNSLRPALNILDGVVAMEGDGPAGGPLRNTGLIMASNDGVALDRVVCEIVNGNKDLFFTLESARQLRCGETDLSNIEVLGEDLTSGKIKDFRLPRFIKVSDMGPGFLRRYIRLLTTSRPVQVRKNCKLCGVCQKACPAKAIEMKNGRLYFYYDQCISCFCCAELCQYKGIRVSTPIFAYLLR